MNTELLIAMLWDWIIIQFQLILAAVLGIIVVIAFVELFLVIKRKIIDPLMDR